MRHPLLGQIPGPTRPPRSSPRHWRCRGASGPRRRSELANCEGPSAGSGWSSLSSLSTLPDRVFREDLLDSLEGLLGSGLRRHPASHDIDPAGTPGMLVLDLGIGRVEGPKVR